MGHLKQHIAIVGATGNVGRKFLEVMEKRNFIPETLSLLASPKSAGKKINFNGKQHEVQALEAFDFSQASLAFFSAGGEVAKNYAPKAAEAGAVVIDNSSHFRMHEEVVLCVPEVNGDELKKLSNKKSKGFIVANPNCSTAQLVLALAPLHRAKKIERAFVATYQSASGAGKQTMVQLVEDIKNNTKSNQSLAFNVIPKIDAWRDNGETKEEWKMRVEVQKILDDDIAISTHCVRVPVLVGHSEAVFLRFAEKITPKEAGEILQKAEGCVLSSQEYETPIECEGKDEVFISRLRQDPNDEKAIQLWITADNLLKGAALNAIQIAERLMKV